MGALRMITAGESHGPGLTCVVEGLPAGLPLDRESINRDMARRQLGHGRGGRMKIERDSAETTGGVRHGRTLGGPVALWVANRDYANWEERMSPWPVDGAVEEVHLPRPGHADLAGVWKYGFSDVRNVLERAVILSGEGTITKHHLPRDFGVPVGARPVQQELEPDVVRLPVGTTVGEAEKALIQATLQHTRNNKTRAAEILGISLKTLFNKLKEYGSAEAEAGTGN